MTDCGQLESGQFDSGQYWIGQFESGQYWIGQFESGQSGPDGVSMPIKCCSLEQSLSNKPELYNDRIDVDVREKSILHVWLTQKSRYLENKSDQTPT